MSLRCDPFHRGSFKMDSVQIVRLFERKRAYIFLFGGFFVVEALLAMWTGNPYDMGIWFNTGSWMNQGINIYEPANHLGYPPLWSFWCLIAYRSYNFFGNSMEVWRLIIKLPMMLAHLALTYRVGNFALKEFGRKKALRIFYLVLVWSFFLYVGALWGQTNTLSALLTFLAFEAMLNQKTRVSALFLGLAVTLKLYPIVVIPAFVIFSLKRRGKHETRDFILFITLVPLLITGVTFLVFRWNPQFFLNTMFYWVTPKGGKISGNMNFWPLLQVLNVDLVALWPIRYLWVFLMVGCMIFWLKKSTLKRSDFSFSIVSFYLIFIISYGWVSEQSFIDPLPFIFLVIIGYRHKLSNLYLGLLSIIQILMYAYSVNNRGLLIFEPLLNSVSPPLLSTVHNIYADYGALIWTLRGILGFIISLGLGIFLLIIWKPNYFPNRIRIIIKKLFPKRSQNENLV
jgi:Gpi18-like mannosyltransferase